MGLKAANAVNGDADEVADNGTPNDVEPKVPEGKGKGSKKRKRNSEGRHVSREDNMQTSVKDAESAAKKKRKRKHRKNEGETYAQQV